MDRITLDALMAQLGEAGKAGEDVAAHGLMKIAESVAQRAKKDFGLSIDDAQYVLKDFVCDINKKGRADAKGKGRFVQSYISTIAKDRDSEAILPEAVILDDYRALPIVLRSHLYSEIGLGKNEWIVPNEKSAVERMHSLLAKTIFASEKANPLAEQLYQWSIEDMPIGDSIGFIPVEWLEPQDKGWEKLHDSWVKRTTAFLALKGREATADMLDGLKRIFTKVIMLEYSKVMIPSNPFAVSLAVEKGLLLESEQDAYTLKEGGTKEFIEDDAPVNRLAASLRRVYPDGDPILDDLDAPLKDGGKGLGIEDISFKAGREISAKNRKMLAATRDATDSATVAIDDLLTATDLTPNEGEPGKALGKAVGPWNKSLDKSFDIAEYDEANTVFRYSLFTKFLDCQVKHIYVNSYSIPSPLLGTYLEAISIVTDDMAVDDTRRFSYEGKEFPPSRSYIQLNSRRRKRFLVDGSQYCHDGDMALVKDFAPSWGGMQFSIITSDGHEARSDEIMNAIHEEANSNHMLKGEKFALSGEFLSNTDDEWDELIINAKDKQAIQKSMNITSKSGGNSRGLLFVGPPGTGKTKAGRTIMNDTDSTYIWVSARDFMYGMPSSIMALAFDMARKLAPTVLFMEDIDRSLDKDMLKTELDGLKQNKGLMTILTTNHPDKLPKALIDRPGRFHHVILFDLPDDSQRKQMFKLWAGDISEAILDELVKATEGFSGAHINHLVEYSLTIAEDEDMSAGAALVESMIRMSDQMDLVAGLQRVETKELFNEEELRRTGEEAGSDLVDSEITPGMAQYLLDQDDEEKKAAGDDKIVTFAERLLAARGKKCV